MQEIAIFIAGTLLGAAGVGLAARWQINRSLARVRAAERRARSAERLAEIGAMTGGLAHEIKNPLSTIGLNAQLLSEGLEELPFDRAAEPEVRTRLGKRLNSLRREVERLRGILTDFLQYAGELRLDVKPADLNVLVEELADFFMPQAEQQGVRLRVELAPQPLKAMLDGPQVKQAVLNLMLNAVQAMNGAGQGHGGAKELILRTELAKEKPEGGGTEKLIRLHVIDTGPGIPQAVMDKLFTPYFTTKAGGTGLGLPTTRRIIEAHHGRIEPYTAAGTGTDFVITFPTLSSQMLVPGGEDGTGAGASALGAGTVVGSGSGV